MIRQYWFYLFLFGFLAFAFAGTRPLVEPDEGRYGEVAREMLVSGDWLMPRLHGHEHLTKPPLTYWLTATGMALFGVNEWGARGFHALAYLGTILCVIGLGRSWGWKDREALAGGLVFATALLPFICGHLLTTDIILTFWETLGVYCAWQVWGGAGRVGLWRRGFWLAFGMAFLTKGPPGWLPLLALVIFCGLSRRHQPRARLGSWGGLGVMLAVAFAWFVALVVIDPSLAEYFIKDEFIERVASTEHQRQKFAGYYLVVILVGFLPWTFLLPGMICRAWRTLAGATFGRRLGRWQSVRKIFTEVIPRMEPVRLFSVLWFAVPLIVFCLAKSKMILYLTPLMVPLALWGGRRLVGILTPERLRLPKWRWSLVGVGVVWVGFLMGTNLAPDSMERIDTYHQFAVQLQEAGLSPEVPILVRRGQIHSVSFYTGLRQESLVALTKSRIFRCLQVTAREYGSAVLILKETRLDDIVREGQICEVIAKQKGLIAIRVDRADGLEIF